MFKILEMLWPVKALRLALFVKGKAAGITSICNFSIIRIERELTRNDSFSIQFNVNESPCLPTTENQTSLTR